LAKGKVMMGFGKISTLGCMLCVLGFGAAAGADTIVQLDFDNSTDNGTTFTDASGNGHDAVYNKAVTLQESDPFDAKGAEAKNKSAATTSSQTKGKQTYAKLSKLDTIKLSTTNRFTLEGWVKLASLPGKEGGKLVQISSKDGGTTSIVLMVNSEGKAWARVYSKGGGGEGFASTSTIPLETWMHLALTYDGKNAALYVNGKQEATKQVSRSLPKAVNLITVGNYVAGAIDDVRISDQALSAEELGFSKSLTGMAKATGSAPPQPAGESTETPK